MSKSLFALSVLALATSSAFATCHNGATNWPDCNNNKPPQSAPSTSSANAGAAAGAAAGAVAGSKSVSEATGGNALATGGDSSATVKANQSLSGTNQQRQQQQQAQQQRQSLSSSNANQSAGGAGGQVVIEGNQAGSGDRNSFVAWAPVIHGPAAPALASANLVVVPGVCGPRVRVITTQIIGQHYPAFGKREEEHRGYMETLGPWLNDDGNPGNPFVWRDGFMLGHVVTQYAAVVATSSAASFSLGGFVDSKGLQGGAAGSGAAQQLVKSLQVMDCVMPVQPVPAAVPVVAPSPVVKPRPRPVVRRLVVAPCNCKR